MAFVVVIGCGRKGPPLPPLLKLPQAPGEIAAVRHGNTVDLQFIVPVTNTDGTRPANVATIEVYGITGSASVTEEQILKLGTKIARLAIKAPRDPDKTIEPDEPESEMDPPEGRGLDQGVLAHVEERLAPEANEPADLTKAGKGRRPKASPADVRERPLLSPDLAVPSRWYAAVSVSAKGRRGPLSSRAAVAMVDPPPTLQAPTITYDETAVAIAWLPIGAAAATPPAADGVLPSRPVGAASPTITYNVYEVAEATPPVLTRLSKTALEEPLFSDARMTWGARRCYAVRVVKTIDDAAVEGDESPPGCVTLLDTFPPAAPTGLQAVASEGAINLIWDANTEKDIRGYLVMRGIAPAETLEQMTPDPIQETSYKDAVKPGVRFVFAVRAVDTAGNLSPESARVEETAR